MKDVSRNQIRLHRKKRIRAKISGTKSVPRVCVFKSLRRIEVQAIDDENGKTLVSLDTKMMKSKNDVDGAAKLGKEFAKKCLAAKIERIVFDRGGYKFHGKINALAEGMRGEGIKF